MSVDLCKLFPSFVTLLIGDTKYFYERRSIQAKPERVAFYSLPAPTQHYLESCPDHAILYENRAAGQIVRFHSHRQHISSPTLHELNGERMRLYLDLFPDLERSWHLGSLLLFR